MRRYETLFIATPESSDEDLKAISSKFRDIVTGMNGLVAAYNAQGKKKLAYSVRKQSKGHYVLMDYLGSADLVAEIERNMRLDDRILKYITVKLADSVDPESVESYQTESQREGVLSAVPEPDEVEVSESDDDDEEE